MIPKTIHYCWFGNAPLTPLAQRCMASWHRHLPDYEVVRWDERNFDLDTVPYVREAWERGQYAFVSDYVRFFVLYREGGLYFDTDVELVRGLDDIVARGAFMGTDGDGYVAPGLGLGAESGLAVYKEILDHYARLHFETGRKGGVPDTVVKHVTGIFRRHGLAVVAEPQQLAGVWIYPNDYFDPLDDATGRLCVTANTRSIHWYAKSWVGHYGPWRARLARWAHRLVGTETTGRIRRWLKL